MGMLLY